MSKRVWSALVIGGMLTLSACNADNGNKMNEKPASEMNDSMQSNAPMNDDETMNDEKMMNDSMQSVAPMNDDKMMDDGMKEDTK
ncbi:hypothetical protein PghCCS26_39040 [Paenibacillus glycanilyticus]|uniref:Pentapeptide MXKDX repeat protein n=1 Tax=Paenibacillus glycanilyticus TaxID=126569 RepID=A0ABQ6NNV4_9BACL|nr:hypothetical protein [Paenibacillus glycanilyticus]GMK46775.1 hypothetical protein PghCCS26_39040 [Paenibacillus glycanilyticus]